MEHVNVIQFQQKISAHALSVGSSWIVWMGQYNHMYPWNKKLWEEKWDECAAVHTHTNKYTGEWMWDRQREIRRHGLWRDSRPGRASRHTPWGWADFVFKPWCQPNDTASDFWPLELNMFCSYFNPSSLWNLYSHESNYYRWKIDV